MVAHSAFIIIARRLAEQSAAVAAPVVDESEAQVDETAADESDDESDDLPDDEI
jgi:hypothetical protein